MPNEKVITERVENLSLADTRVLLTTDVTVGYDSDVDQVQQILCEAALGERARAHGPAAGRAAGHASAPTGWSSTCCSGSPTRQRRR